MEFTNSGLVTYKNLTQNKTTGRRGKKIDTITIHCFVGQVTAKRGCDYFYNQGELYNQFEIDPVTGEKKRKGRGCSSTYVIGYDGSIGLSVPEADRPWTTGGEYTVNGETGSMNDYHAVTIEVACETKHPYEVTDAAYNALIKLVADIAKRNNMGLLKWKNDKTLVGQPDKQNMTLHSWFANKSCPGKYLHDRMGDIANKANQLNGITEKPVETKPEAPQSTLKVGDLVKIIGTQYYSGKTIPAWVKSQNWIVKSVNSDRVVIDKNESGTNSICSPVNASDLKVCVVGGINTPEKEKPAETAPVTSYKVGDKVRLKQGACVYNKTTKYQSWVYKTDLFVRSVSGDRIVVSTVQTGPVTGPVHKNDLIKI